MRLGDNQWGIATAQWDPLGWKSELLHEAVSIFRRGRKVRDKQWIIFRY